MNNWKRPTQTLGALLLISLAVGGLRTPAQASPHAAQAQAQADAVPADRGAADQVRTTPTLVPAYPG